VSGRRAAQRSLVVGALTAAAVNAAARALTRSTLRSDPVGPDRWERTNYRGREVTLLLGPAVGIGALAGVCAAAPRARTAALLAVSSAAAVGVYDDLYGDRHARGLGGHARALREGRVTTGMVKLVTMAGAAGVASTIRYRTVIDASLGTVLVAGTANLVNLFDLRPGRAAKVTAIAAAAMSGSRTGETRAVAAVAAGAALAAMPSDLGERAMLGDCGASTLGALLGWAAGLSGSRRRRALLAGAVIGLTVVSERVSFSSVIESQPALRALDQLGRRP
jgi:UDP-GlcNAc:undecaprenyl-phosphate/decaprenyl-phosphate GlcNAc-1-phosphate transferase